MRQGIAQSGNRVCGESGDSLLPFGVPEMAVGPSTVAVLLEHGAPSITLEIQGKLRRLIVDVGSNISILQPGYRGGFEGHFRNPLWSDWGNPGC
jgi:hypothetical protein